MIKYEVKLRNAVLRGYAGFLRCHSGKESTCQRRRCRFDPWVGKIPWRKAWQPTPVFLPGESYGQRSLAGYSPWGLKPSDTTEHAYTRDLQIIPILQAVRLQNKTRYQEKLWLETEI